MEIYRQLRKPSVWHESQAQCSRRQRQEKGRRSDAFDIPYAQMRQNRAQEVE